MTGRRVSGSSIKSPYSTARQPMRQPLIASSWTKNDQAGFCQCSAARAQPHRVKIRLGVDQNNVWLEGDDLLRAIELSRLTHHADVRSRLEQRAQSSPYRG